MLFTFQFLCVMLFTLLIMAYEFRLFFSFNFKLNVRRLDVCWNLDKDLAFDNVARLVEWELSLKLHFTTSEIAARISEIKHILTNNYKKRLMFRNYLLT